jgi:hypothetical protein
MPRSPLYDLALHETLQAHPELTDSSREEAEFILDRFINGSWTYSQAASLYLEKFHTSAPLDRLREILSVPSEPLATHALSADGAHRRRNQQWMPVEDTRLWAAIHKYGTENWNLIARYVGNGRTRSQCSQRWQRGLDPRISRSRWSAGEEALLLQLVATYGKKSWIRISNALGNRSDVQCRYRFHQIQKGRTASDDGAPDGPGAGPEDEPGADAQPPPEAGAAEQPGELAIEPFTLDRIGLELGAHSTSEIFWMLHQ